MRFFVENKEGSCSIRALSKRLKINYRIAYEKVKELEEKKVLRVEKLGNSNQCSFSPCFNEVIWRVEDQRREELLKNPTLKVLYRRILEIQNPFFICLVFGSYAKGTQTKHSDIDICVIADPPEIQRKIEETFRLLPDDFQLQLFTTKEFISMLQTTQPNVGKEIVKHNVILKGAEAFYEVLCSLKKEYEKPKPTQKPT